MKKIVFSLCLLGIFSCNAQSFFDVLQDLTGIGNDSPQEDAALLKVSEEPQEGASGSIEELIIGVDQLSPSQNIATQGVLLHGLDKETARVFAMKAAVGEEISFGTLKIKVHHCEMAPPDKRPESTAFVSITDGRSGDEKPLFNGWMFASSPALSALDHPVFDVWVKSCVEIELAP